MADVSPIYGPPEPPREWIADDPTEPPPESEYPAVCDVCGRRFKKEHGVTMHKARAHSGKNWAGAKKSKDEKAAVRRARVARRKETKPTPPAPRPDAPVITLRELIQVDERILLVDVNTGEWWVAKKLDV
jgi:hypothetical protein